jgi:Flp pilus assembly protein TadD
LRAAFGVDADDLIPRLRAYAEQAPYYRSAMPYPLPAVEPAVRGLAADEIAAELGRLALVRGGYRQSQEFFVAALEANPLNANALAGMGAIHAHAKRFDEAERSFAAAVAAEPANGYHELDWGEYLLQRASSETDAVERDDLLVEARRHFARSHDVDPNSAETLAQIGLSYLGEDAAKAVTSLEEAYRLLPSQPALARHLAKAYIDAGRPQLARQLLNYLLASADAENVDELVALLDTLPQS